MIFIFYFLLWWIWFYDYKKTQHIILFLMEKDICFLLGHVSKKSAQAFFIQRSIISLVLAVISYEFLDFNTLLCSVLFILIYKFQYILLLNKYKIRLKKADLEFPFLLDKLASLVQVNTIPVSIAKSIDEAPDLFKNDLNILVNEIHCDGDSLVPYIHFAKKYHQIEEIESIMRTLYSLSTIGKGKETILINFCNMSNNKLIQRKKIDDENVIDHFNLYSYILYASMGILLLGMFSTMNFFNL